MHRSSNAEHPGRLKRAVRRNVGRLLAVGLAAGLGLGTVEGVSLEPASAAVTCGCSGKVGSSIGKAAGQMLAKAAKKTGKERASDVPSWARGVRKKPGETPDQATVRVYGENGKAVPGNKGPGTEYNKIKKYLSRN